MMRLLVSKGKNAFALLIFVFAFFMSCSDSSNNLVQRQWYYEDELLSDVMALPEKTVILNLQYVSESKIQSPHSVNYFYPEEGIYTYCIDEEDPYITSMAVTDSSGKTVIYIKKGECAYTSMKAGKYSKTIYHNPQDVPPEGTVAFIYEIKPEKGFTTKGDPSIDKPYPKYPVFGAMKIQSNNLNNAYLFRIASGSRDWEGYEYDVLQVFRDWGAQRSDWERLVKEYRHLFSIDYKGGNYPYWFRAWDGRFDNRKQENIAVSCKEHPEYCANSQQRQEGDKVIMPSWNAHPGRFDFLDLRWDYPYFTFMNCAHLNWCEFYADTDTRYLYYLSLKTTEPKEPAWFQMDDSFRAYKQASDMAELPSEGEIAIYEGKDYTGTVFVLRKDFQSLYTVWLNRIRSIRLGFNTTALVYTGYDFRGTPQVIGSNRGDIDIENWDTRDGDKLVSIKLIKSRNILISSRKCDGCNLAMVDLSNLNLSGVSLKNAILYGANFNYANLQGSNLCGAFLNGHKEMSNSQAASLQGAYLKNINLTDANMDGADFRYASMYSPGVSSCQPGCDRASNCATAYHATMNSAKFNNAYLNGVDMSATNARGANFSGAVLLGVNFADARLTSDPNTGATVSFSGAFLQGVSFGGAQTTGADFTNAYVDLSSTNGNTMIFLLTGNYTSFSGFWGTRGANVCVKFTYPEPSRIPSTDNSNRCPDSGLGPCSNERWTKPVIPINQALPRSAYINDRTKPCDKPDSRW